MLIFLDCLEKMNPLPDVLGAAFIEQELIRNNDLVATHNGWIDEVYNELENDDNVERFNSKDGRSNYEVNCVVDGWCGHKDPSRFWCNQSVHQVDGTMFTSLYVGEQYYNNNKNYVEWYESSKGSYREVVTQLSRHVKEREFGRVFFSTETRYVAWNQKGICPRRKAHLIEGYIKKGNKKMYNNKYQKPLKGVLYKDRGSSILKKLTLQGKIAESIFSHVESMRYNPDSQNRRDGSIAKEFFFEIMNNYNYDIWDWACDKAKVNPTTTKELLEQQRQANSKFNHLRLFDDHVNCRKREGVKCKYLCITIQRRWRKVYFVRKRNARIIQKHWRSFLVQAVKKGLYEDYSPIEYPIWKRLLEWLRSYF